MVARSSNNAGHAGRGGKQMNQTEAIKKAGDRLNLCIHISECSENKGRDKQEVNHE
jgi:hypothetical protein